MQLFMRDLKLLSISFLTKTLSTNFSYLPHDDYKEMIKLCLLVFGISVGKEPYQFAAPGAEPLDG